MEAFLQTYTHEQRLRESRKLIIKYCDRVPILIKPGNAHTPEVDKFKYLVPHTLKVCEFASVIRKKIKLKSYQALFIHINGILPPMNTTIFDIYQEYQSEDGFLYITYSLENTFGSIFSFFNTNNRR